MNFWDRIKIALASFRTSGGIELPDSGRSSVETLGSSMSAYLSTVGTVSPIVDFEMLRTLKCLWLFNPDFSQYVANVVNLGNPGHRLSVSAGSDSAAEAAVSRLNESAARIYTHGVGVDGLINQYLASVAWSGAISSEDVVDFRRRRVERVVIVPVEQIRFRYERETDSYAAFQRASTFARRQAGDAAGLIRLNPETYRYYALSTIENSPYARPPGTAAIDAIMKAQVPIMENLRYIAQKFGLLGFLTASVAPPAKKPSETQGEYESRAGRYLTAVKNSLQGSLGQGLVAAFRDQRLEHTDVSDSASGVYDLNRISEEQIFSGLGTQPGFHGRTDSTTETFADVVYYLLTAQVSNMQRLVKRRQERTYRLDLRLGGIDVSDITIEFKKTHSRNAKAEAETEQIEFTTVLEKARAGLLAPSDAARELGYESWFDPSALDPAAGAAGSQSASQAYRESRRVRLSLEFNKAAQRYARAGEITEIRTSDSDASEDRVVPFAKKKRGA